MLNKVLRILLIVAIFGINLVIYSQSEAYASNWSTDGVILEFSKLEITADGKKFQGTDDIFVHSEVGKSDSTTLDATWTEHEIQMRLQFLFTSVNDKWSIKEIKTYDGKEEATWLTYSGLYGGDLGTSYFVDSLNLTSKTGDAKLNISNLRILPLFITNKYINQIITPKENETFSIGTNLPISWKLSGNGSAEINAPFATSIYLNKLVDEGEQPEPIIISDKQKLTNLGINNLSWPIIGLTEGNYKLNIEVYLKYSGSDAIEKLVDQTEDFITITSQIISPTITIFPLKESTAAAKLSTLEDNAPTITPQVTNNPTLTQESTKIQEGISPTTNEVNENITPVVPDKNLDIETETEIKKPNILQRFISWLLTIFKS